jgi:CubicO group peptidase (beta-lactamase class C family)
MKICCSNSHGRSIRWFVITFAALIEILGGSGLSLQAAIPQTGCYKREGLNPKVESVIDKFRALVPDMMDKGDVPGAAIALVDDCGILWTEGFGYTASKPRKTVTPDTPFLLCSLSKLITATAVMLAVQDGIVNLDEPVTTYLPDFKINSRYENRPEQKITLRRLLSYTAGLPVETPLGNCFEPSSTVSFEDHVKSLYGTWLACPVGSSFYQSGASSDLAAYVIQVVTGQPYEKYLKDRLFAPLGMSNSTADRKMILKNSERAIGHMEGISKLPAVYPALGAGGMYSTARDMARFLQLHINQGTFDNLSILDQGLMDTIYRPMGIARTDPNVYYGLGIHIDKRSPERTETLLWHDGWGFGFMSLIHWYPEYGVGVIVLTNQMPHSVLADLSFTLTNRLVKEKAVQKRFRWVQPDCSHCVGPWWGWPDHTPTPYKREWKQYLGSHSLRFSAYSLKWWANLAVGVGGRDEYTPLITVSEKGGYLCVTESQFFERISGFRSVDEKLQEVKPGVFAIKGGGILDFTREVPTWCNYRLEEK